MLTHTLLLSLLCCVSSFTPPRIIYGGWTPILPGHPFYFGKVSKYHYTDQVSYGHQASGHYHDSIPQDQDTDDYRSYRYGKSSPRYNGGRGISHIHTKSQFSYHPQKPSYGQSPRYPKAHTTKPVYNEIPRKPLDIFENPHKHVNYIPPVRDLTLQDLKVLDHGGKEAYLQGTSMGKVHPNSIKPVGHVNLGAINSFANVNTLNYQSNHGAAQLLRNYDAGLYKSPHESKYNPASSFSHGPLYNSKPYGSHGITNTFTGTSFPHSESDVIRNTKDASKASLFSGSTHSSLHKTPYHTTSKDLYPSGSFDMINQVKSNPKFKFYSGVKSHHTTPFASPSSYNNNQYPNSIQSIIQSEQNPSARTPENHQTLKANKNYDYKNVGVGNFYRNQDTLSKVHQDIPTIVNKEVEVVHIPSSIPHQYSSNTDQEHVLYINGGSTSKPSSGKYRSSKFASETIVEEPIEFHIMDDGPNADSVAAGSHRVPAEESVFVGTRSLDSRDVQSVSVDSRENKLDDSIEKKQFFHAYYAPSGHTPPEGYLKMSPEEFSKLFKDAEIQYVQRSEGEGLRAIHVAEKRSS
ncbi:hypothetical protein JTE90_006377 [Oedothorax gibbosus]|nr:hypothetical protein JTE90_006377 [Oedothorax gibbosus]